MRLYAGGARVSEEARVFPAEPTVCQRAVRFVTVNGKDGVRARVMTGADRVYEARTGCKRGYFALLDSAGDEDAVRMALEEACRLQREWGNVEMVGPLSPDGSGFLCGVGAAAADEVAAEDNPCGVRIAAGNSAAERELPRLETVDETCGVRVPEENPLRGIAAVADNSRGVLTGRVQSRGGARAFEAGRACGDGGRGVLRSRAGGEPAQGNRGARRESVRAACGAVEGCAVS